MIEPEGYFCYCLYMLVLAGAEHSVLDSLWDDGVQAVVLLQLYCVYNKLLIPSNQNKLA